MAISIALILCSIALAVAAQLLLKTGMNQLNATAGQTNGPVAYVLSLVRTPQIVIGFACYGLGAVFWLAVLSRVDLSFAYPMLALMYVLIPLTAKFFLAEEIQPGRWLGIAVVLVGVLILARFGE
jgi:multidrug transporter EmrE-like cation transporter